MRSKIFIITPVYNSAQFIGDTVKSVQNQTVTDWQLILVDDCSTDNSLEVIRQIAENDNRIHVLTSEKNSGPAHARNLGIKYAFEQGANYLAFIDSDDKYKRDFLETMVNAAKTSDADIVWCNYVEEGSSTSCIREHGYEGSKCLTDSEVNDLLVRSRAGLGSMWNKLYRCSFVCKSGILLNEERFRGEDAEFNYDLLHHGARVCPIPQALYCYVRQNADSVMNVYHHSDYAALERLYNRNKAIAEESSIPFDQRVYYSNQVYYITTLFSSLLHSKIDIDKDKEFKYIAEDSYFRGIIKSGNYDLHLLTIKQKVYFWLIRYRMYGIAKVLISEFK